MKNTGAIFYRFKQQEKYIVKKLDGPKRATRVDCDRQDIPRHADVNSQGRTWTF
jgi:hypothetical protein